MSAPIYDMINCSNEICSSRFSFACRGRREHGLALTKCSYTTSAARTSHVKSHKATNGTMCKLQKDTYMFLLLLSCIWSTPFSTKTHHLTSKEQTTKNEQVGVVRPFAARRTCIVFQLHDCLRLKFVA